MKSNDSKAYRLNIVLLIVTAILAAVLAFGLLGFYSAYRQEMIRRDLMPVLIGAIFALFLLLVCMMVFFVSSIQLSFRADVISGRLKRGRIFLYLLIGVLACFLVMAGSEYLYEQDLQTHTSSDEDGTYVFLIDDSPSMLTNDPDRLRYSAIGNILNQKSGETRFAVYSFANDAKVVTPMRTVAEGVPQFPEFGQSGTNMMRALETVMNDYEQGGWTGKGNTTVVLITDGVPHDFDSLSTIQPLLDRYVQSGIPIGIVGVIGADSELMNEVAAYTGGTFVDVNSIDRLIEAVHQVSGSDSIPRDLLSIRRNGSPDWLYALIRAVAFSLAGILIAVVAALAYGNSTVFNFIIWTNIIKAVLAGILMEAAFSTSNVIPCMLAWTLMGTILAKYGDAGKHEAQDLDFYDTTGAR